MTWPAALASGFGLGLAYFGALWLSIRGLHSRRGHALRFAGGWVARLAMAGVFFFVVLTTGGVGAVLAGLIGVVLARRALVRQLGRMPDVG